MGRDKSMENFQNAPTCGSCNVEYLKYVNYDLPGNDINSSSVPSPTQNNNILNQLSEATKKACSASNKCYGYLVGYNNKEKKYYAWLKSTGDTALLRSTENNASYKDWIGLTVYIKKDPNKKVMKPSWKGYETSTNGRCGPNHGNQACPGNQCCSQFGWCGGIAGNNDDWCKKYNLSNGEFDARDPKKVAEEKKKLAEAEAAAKKRVADAAAQKKAADDKAKKDAADAAAKAKALADAEARAKSATNEADRQRALAAAEAQKKAFAEAQKRAAAAAEEQRKRAAASTAAIAAQQRVIAQAQAQRKAIEAATKKAIEDANKIILQQQKAASGKKPAPNKSYTIGPLGKFVFDVYENADQQGNDIGAKTGAPSGQYNISSYNAMIMKALNECANSPGCVGVVTAYHKPSKAYTYYLKNRMSAGTLVGTATPDYKDFARVDAFVKLPYKEPTTNVGPPLSRVCADVRYNNNVSEYCNGPIPSINDMNTVCNLKPGYQHDIRKCGVLGDIYSEKFENYEEFANIDTNKVNTIMTAYNRIINSRKNNASLNKNINNYKNQVVKIWNNSIDVFYSNPIYVGYGSGYSKISSFNQIKQNEFENKLGILIERLFKVCQDKNFYNYNYCVNKPTFYDDLEQLYRTSIVIVNAN